MIKELMKLTYKKIMRTNQLILVLLGVSFLAFLYLAVIKRSVEGAMTVLILILPYLGLLFTAGMIKDEIESRHLDMIISRTKIKTIFWAKFLAIWSIVVFTLAAGLIFAYFIILFSRDVSDFSDVLRQAFNGLILSLNLVAAGLFLSSWLKGQLNFVVLFFSEFGSILLLNKLGWTHFIESWTPAQAFHPKLIVVSFFYPFIINHLGQWPVALLLLLYSAAFLFLGYLRFKSLGLKNNRKIRPAIETDHDISFKAEGLEKSYPAGLFKKKAALNGVSFGAGMKKITGFLGPNGAGKTTTLRLLMGFMKQDKGVIEYFVEGNDRATRGKIGYLSETPSFFPFLSAKEILCMTARLEKVKPEDRASLVEKTAERLGLVNCLQQKIKTLSKGTLQKLALSIATLGQPEVLLLDEPYSGLDPVIMNEIRKFIVDLRENGKTIFLSSHLLTEVDRLCDEAVLINEGKIVCQGKVTDLKWKWRLFRAANASEELRQRLFQEKKIDVSNQHYADFLRNDLEGFSSEKKVLEEVAKISEPDLEAVFLEGINKLQPPARTTPLSAGSSS